MVSLNIQKLMWTKESVNCCEEWLYQQVTSQLLETVTYVFTDIPFMGSHSVTEMIPKHGRTESTKLALGQWNE